MKLWITADAGLDPRIIFAEIVNHLELYGDLRLYLSMPHQGEGVTEIIVDDRHQNVLEAVSLIYNMYERCGYGVDVLLSAVNTSKEAAIKTDALLAFRTETSTRVQKAEALIKAENKPLTSLKIDGPR